MTFSPETTSVFSTTGLVTLTRLHPSPKCLGPPRFVTASGFGNKRQTTCIGLMSHDRFQHHMTSVHFSDCQLDKAGQSSDWRFESTRCSYTAQCAPHHTAPHWRQQSKCFSRIQNPSRTRYVPLFGDRLMTPWDPKFQHVFFRNLDNLSSKLYTELRPAAFSPVGELRIVCQI